MCPLPGMVQFLSIALALLLLCHVVSSSDWELSCGEPEHELHMYDVRNVTCNITGPIPYSEYKLVIKSDDSNILKADDEFWITYMDDTNEYNPESFIMTGHFLGKTSVSIIVEQRGDPTPLAVEVLEVTVIRKKRVIDTVFGISVAVLVSIMYINFGCALNWGNLKTSLKRPVGPVIAFVAQFLFMPLLSFGIGKLLFPGNYTMQLGMFFTGVSPAGGASNMWAVILGGNLDLSITMTTISTFAAFGMMPLWLFTLGRVLFDAGDIEIPYAMISEYAVCLVIPLFIGFLMQRYLKKISRFLAKILKGLSSCLLLFIIIFATVTNLYLFELFSWQIVIAGLGLPLFGYITAWCLALICKQSLTDCMTIAIEAGIQNTGISIFMLRFSLKQPEADLTTVVPVAVAIMTPLPLLCMYIYKLIKTRCCSKHGKLENSELNSPMSELESDNNFHTKGPKSISTLS